MISPIVVVPKANRCKAKQCNFSDMQGSNEAPKRERHLIPKLGEILQSYTMQSVFKNRFQRRLSSD